MAFIKKEPIPPNLLKKYQDKYGAEALAVDMIVRFLIASSELEKMFEKHFASVELSQGRFATLMVLLNTEEGRAKPIELAEKLGVTRGNMTGILDNLERDQMIGRQDDEVDRRVNYVFLTDKAKKLLRGFLPKHFELVNSVAKGLDKKEKLQLIELVEKFKTHFLVIK